MSLSIADIVQIFNLADYVRPFLPWTWRLYATSALIWSGILAACAVIALGTHFLLREKPKVDWNFFRDGRPFAAGWGTTEEGAIIDYRIQALQISGENVSGHNLHQISGRVTLPDKRELPLFIAADGAWAQTSEIEPVKPFAMLNMGASFRSDGVTWPEFRAPMTPEAFIQAFGGCTISVAIDGYEQAWTFSVDQLRKAIASQLKEAQERQLRGLSRPDIHRKKPLPATR
jgi:hypothetical protein